jgi:hypothetical protein
MKWAAIQTLLGSTRPMFETQEAPIACTDESLKLLMYASPQGLSGHVWTFLTHCQL